jgi:hypothetical protein
LVKGWLIFDSYLIHVSINIALPLLYPYFATDIKHGVDMEGIWRRVLPEKRKIQIHKKAYI